MEPKTQTDHIAILSLMMVGVLTKRLKEINQLDDETTKHLHKLVKSVGVHAESSGVSDLKSLFKVVDKTLG